METTLESSRSGTSAKLFIFMFMLIGAIAVGVYFFSAVQIPTTMEIHVIKKVSNHAWDKHGINADKAIQCLIDNGSMKSFRTSMFDNFTKTKIPTNTFVCDGKDGNYYGVVTTFFEKVGGDKVARLVTAYKVDKVLEVYYSELEKTWEAVIIKYVILPGMTRFER